MKVYMDPLTKAEVTAHPEKQDYTMLRCRKCGAFYLSNLGHTKANCKKIAVTSKINSNANIMLGAYNDYYHKK